MAIIGTAFVQVRPDTKGFEREATQGIGGAMKKAAGVAAAALAGVRVGGFLKDAVAQSSDLNETVSKGRNIFGGQAAAIEKWSKTSATSFGLSQSAALAATSQFGNMFQQLGFTGAESARASKNLVKTAADLGSFNNVDPSDVLERIGGALRGEYDSLQQLIPNINAARVEHEALAATGKKSAKELTAQEKATATLAIIQRDGAKAAGDFAETSGGLANQQRIAAAQSANLKAKVGDSLRPALEGLAKVGTTQVLPFLSAMATQYGPKVGDFLTRAAAAAGPLMAALKDGPTPQTSSAFSQLGASLATLGPALRDARTELPSLADSISVGSVVVGFLAEHVDDLARYLPYLAAGLVAVKVAQAAGNVAAAASIPLRVVEVAGNVAHTAALRANTAALGGQATAEKVGFLSRIRSTAATIASRVAQVAASAATKAWAATQWILNAALTANPIGLVIAAIALLVGGLIVAYKKSDTFRAIVDGALRAVGKAGQWMWDKALKPALGFLTATFTTVGDAIKRVVDKVLVPVIRGFANAYLTAIGKVLDVAATAASALGMDGLAKKLRGASKKVGDFQREVNAQLDKITDRDVNVHIKTDNIRLVNNKVKANPRMFNRGGPALGPGSETSDSILARLSNNEHVWTAAEVRGAGGHSNIERMRKLAKAGALPAFAAGGRVVDLSVREQGMRSAYGDVAGVINKAAQQMQTDGTGSTIPGGGGGSRANLVAFGRLLQARGFSVAEGPPPFGPVHRVHARNSRHYSGRAIDVNKGAGTSAAEQRAIDGIVPLARLYGLSTIWRQKGHFNHAHFQFDQGGIWRPGTTGVNRSGRPERVLDPAQTEAFERMVAVLEGGGSPGGGGVHLHGDVYDVAPRQWIAAMKREQAMQDALNLTY